MKGDDDNDSSSSSFFRSLLKRDSSSKKSKSDGNDDDDDDDKEKVSSGISIIGRFFSRIEDDGGDGKELRDDDDDDDQSSIRKAVKSVVKGYFQSRRLRKDADALREEVQRQEEERRSKIEKQRKVVEEATKRANVAQGIIKENRQAEVKRQVEILRKIEAQRAVDLKYLERLNRKSKQKRKEEEEAIAKANDLIEIDNSNKQFKVSAKSTTTTGKPSSTKPRKTSLVADGPSAKPKEKKSSSSPKDVPKTEGKDDSSSSSRRFMSVAQKFMTGFFDKEEEWIVVAPKTRIMPGEIVPLTVAGIDLLLVASKDGSQLHCIANSCPHLGTPLELASLERRPIEPSSSLFSFFKCSEARW